MVARESPLYFSCTVQVGLTLTGAAQSCVEIDRNLRTNIDPWHRPSTRHKPRPSFRARIPTFKSVLNVKLAPPSPRWAVARGLPRVTACAAWHGICAYAQAPVTRSRRAVGRWSRAATRRAWDSSSSTRGAGATRRGSRARLGSQKQGAASFCCRFFFLSVCLSFYQNVLFGTLLST